MSVITDYIANLSGPEQEIWNQLRDIVHKEVPDVEEAFTYGVPTYRYKGKYMIGFASTRKGFSIYPGSRMIEIADERLLPFKASKGTLSFTLDNPIPAPILKHIVKSCKSDIDQNVKKY